MTPSFLCVEDALFDGIKLDIVLKIREAWMSSAYCLNLSIELENEEIDL